MNVLPEAFFFIPSNMFLDYVEKFSTDFNKQNKIWRQNNKTQSGNLRFLQKLFAQRWYFTISLFSIRNRTLESKINLNFVAYVHEPFNST